ncbi:MAG: OpgC domain-containing protein [Arthrobacter sp.]
MPPAPASASTGIQSWNGQAGASEAPDPGQGWFFGPALDRTGDNPAGYRDRLGASPSVFGTTSGYPLTSDEEEMLRQFARQASGQGAVVLLTLEPRQALASLDGTDADALAKVLQDLNTSLDTRFMIRFAPEMNGTWTGWGQQPAAYVNAFRTVASSVHAVVPAAAMLWAPAYGAGYPFATALGAVQISGAGSLKELDTNASGSVEAGDDPYGPYYPGDDAADWVGLSIYHFGSLQENGSFATGRRPEAGQFLAQLAGTFGYADQNVAGRDFVARFATDKQKRMAVQTGALYDPADPHGGAEQEIKNEWINQVTAPEVGAQYPALGMVSWLEQQRPEAEADNAVVDWRATANPEVAETLKARLTRPGTGFVAGPVSRANDQQDSTQSKSNQATAQIRDPGTTSGEPMGWIVLCTAVLAALATASALILRLRPNWRYRNEDDPRDLRLDLLRGWIITAVVVTHIEVAGPYSYLALNAIGAISGAELFVLLSGLVMGMVYPKAVAKIGAWDALHHNNRRALKLYLTALGVVVLVYLLSRIPGIDGSVVTSFTDRGTGQGGEGAAGRVYDLYANAPRFFDYPVPAYAVGELLRLGMGPWVFNIMGLFVVLTLAVPALIWLLQRRLWWVVLIVSWVLYITDALRHIRVIDSQFQDVFPLLTWQIVFTHGIVLGYYRKQIVQALLSRRGLTVAAAGAVLYAAVLGLLWANHHLQLQLPWIPSDLYSSLYGDLFNRTFLQPGRLMNLLLFLSVAFIVLTAFWNPLSKAFGWLYIPLGQASLYVFIVHVFFVLAVGNVPGLDRTSTWQGLLVHTVVVGLIWVMVRKKTLFGVIPR